LKGEKNFHTWIRKVKDYRNNQNFLEQFSLKKFPPGDYILKVSLLNKQGKEILTEKEEFIVSSKPVAKPWIICETYSIEDNSLYLFILGSQFLNKGELIKARENLDKAYREKPDSLDYALKYSHVLFILKDYTKIKEILLPFIKVKKENFTLYYYLGKVFQEEGELKKAIFYYQKALSCKGDIVEILNSIAYCYFLLGDEDEALKIWGKSLEINPAQEKIKKIIKILKEKDENNMS